MSNNPIATAIAPVVDNLESSAPSPTVTNKSWYAVNLKAKDNPNDTAEITIYDEIGGWGVSAQQFIKDLKAITASKINLRINSPGGGIFDATAIYNAIKEHPANITTFVDGLAASAGSVIAMSGNEVRMANNAYMMIHNASVGLFGGAQDLERQASLLRKINDNIAITYMAKAGNTKEHWAGLMDAETWFTAEEAKAQGLADVIFDAAPPETAKASFDFKIYNKIPDAVKAMWGIPKQNNPSAPEASVSSEAPPQTLLQEPIMASENVTAPPANPPAAGAIAAVSQQDNQIANLNHQAIQGYIERGRTQGYAEGVQAEQKRMRDIAAAAPGRPEIAVNAFLAGQNASTVSLIADAAQAADIRHRETMQAKEVEIARLNALVATGGHPGVNMAMSRDDNSAPRASVDGLDPTSQAKLEWDSDPMIRARNGNNEKRWMLYRVNELNGNVRVLRPAKMA